ncbi:MAG: ATP-dependent sacrificial sulfur transferase LarE [Candidatus Aminicenantales bacterium]|jgi:uncharacterized protein
MKPAKMNKLIKIVGRYPKAVIAFSGGVDSSLLLKLSSDILGKRNVVAVTGVSQTYTGEEKAVARRFTKELGVRHVLLETDELAYRKFAENPGDRCYYCKQELYGKISRLARQSGIPVIFDATNADDLFDHRPGRKAAAESGVLSPFVLAAWTKKDIRERSKRLGLDSWDKPANPCLASRVPYGTRITAEILKKIHRGETLIRGLGFPVVRLRHHGPIARIEIPVKDFPRIMRPGTLRAIASSLKSLGYLWIALDIEGYRMGSLNRPLRNQGPKKA